MAEERNEEDQLEQDIELREDTYTKEQVAEQIAAVRKHFRGSIASVRKPQFQPQPQHQAAAQVWHPLHQLFRQF